MKKRSISQPIKKTSQQSPSKPSTIFRIRDKKSLLAITDAIQQHIKKRADVEIISHYQQYKQQFFLKCKKLQGLLFEQPALRKYIDERDSHYKLGFQTVMLRLFREGVIVAESYDNVRMDAVKEIETWVLGWLHRKVLAEAARKEEKQQIISSCELMEEIENYAGVASTEQLPF